MRKWNMLALGGFLFSMSAVATAATPYIEGQVGYFMPSDVSTKTYSGSSSGIDFTNLKGDLEYESDFSLGAEIGVSLNNGWRFGLSYKDIDLSFDSGSVSGSATDGSTTIDASTGVTRSDVDALGLTFDSGASLLLVTAYYDFYNDSNTTPFVGLGVGQADVDNLQSNENALALSGGVRHDLEGNWFISAKASYAQIDGGEDKLGIQYEDYEVNSLDLALGLTF